MFGDHLIRAAIAAVMTTSLFSAALAEPAGGDPRDCVFYAGGEGSQRFWCVTQLSDGTFLIGGSTDQFSWMPRGVPATRLAGDVPTSVPTGTVPLLLHVSEDLGQIKRIVGLPRNAAGEIRFIKTTTRSGEKTGDIYVSGRVLPLPDAEKDKGGYFIARLDGNFVDRPPERVVWSHKVRATGKLADIQPWDVGPDGRVVYADGEPYSYNWMAVYALDADGQPAVVPRWPRHWYTAADGSGGEWSGDIADCPGEVTHSGIVLKVWGRGDFRSHTEADFLLETSDGNGGVKQGKWPLDAMFDGYFDPDTKKTVPVTGTGKGYYGYRFGGTPCASVGAICIDRWTGAMFIGGNNKSRLPDGKPDFEPWVVAMDRDGKLLWWQRLYPESKGVSTPDQYVDALAIDYSRQPDDDSALVVVARAHGNNVNNFWTGDSIQHPDNPGRGFQNGFTGTHGNMHYSWIGRMTVADGEMLHATYFAEYAEGAKHQDRPFSDPLIAHWPHFRAGWPDLNTTRVRPTISVDAVGGVYVVAKGRRVITTKNAFMQMPSPLADKGSVGKWSDFVRVYAADLTALRYSSLLSGRWDWATGQGGSDVSLQSVVPVANGVVVVGYSTVDKTTGQAAGDDMPTRNLPAWGAANRTGEMGVVGRLLFQ